MATDAEAKKYVHLAVEMGRQMLYDGAEVERVEDSLKRICIAFGATRAEVFAMPSVVIITVDGDGYNGVTEMQRVVELGRNLERLAAINYLSREICSHHLTIDEAEEQLQAIDDIVTYSLPYIMFFYALLSSAFTLFFGGCASDGLAAAIIGALIAPIEYLLVKLKINRFLRIGACSFICGICTLGCINLGIGKSADLIDIGNIMIFIPGMIFTTAIQEIYTDNMMSGFIKLVESATITAAIATGFIIARFIF